MMGSLGLLNQGTHERIDARIHGPRLPLLRTYPPNPDHKVLHSSSGHVDALIKKMEMEDKEPLLCV